MNYYDEILEKIAELIRKEDYDEAGRLIKNELDVAYVPRDVENKLHGFLDTVNQNTQKSRRMSAEEIEEYLFLDDMHQLLAVGEMDDLNLHQLKDLCERYLLSEGNIYAKAYLMQSMILQNIDAGIKCLKNGEISSFNPSKITYPTESVSYRKAQEALREAFLKEPSMLWMAEELLYKEALLSLPDELSEDEALKLAVSIEGYIRKAFEG